MKIAVTTSGKNLNATLSSGFGRGLYFLLIDTNDMSYEVFENENLNLGNIAALKSASFLINKGTKAVIANTCEPKAKKMFIQQGVKVHNGFKGVVKEVLEKYSPSLNVECIN